MAEDYQELDGTVLEALPNMTFKVQLSNGQILLATIAGKMRRHFIKILPGDVVRIEVTPYDKERGRIVWKGR